MGNMLKEPQIVAEAREAQKGWNWFLELLAFVGVFLVSSIALTIAATPLTMVMMYKNADYQAALTSGDQNKILEVAAQISSSDATMIISLFADIVMILVVILFCKLLQKRRVRTIGFVKEGAVKEYLMGLLAGFLVFSATVLICMLTGALKFEGLSDSFAPGMFILYVLGYMIQGMAEEVLCRGYFMVSIARRYPFVAAAVINAVFFAALHLSNPGITPLAFINLSLFGIFASVYFIKRGNIWGIGAFHSIWNLVQGNFYGIKVSGLTSNCTVFDTAFVEGKEFFNGGSFGMEGGIATTIVLVVGIIVLCLMKKKETAETIENVETTENAEA